jgi:hypothetical protein
MSEPPPGTSLAPASVIARRHAPMLQAKPVQQSSVTVHPRPSPRHAQRPISQSMCPQQSMSRVHPRPAAWQQNVDVISRWHW